MIRQISPIICLAAISSCSYTDDVYTYAVQASITDGRLSFDANPQWGIDCIRVVEVTSGEEGAETVWKQSVSYEHGCDNKFPISYGKPFAGRSRPIGDSELDVVKALRVGVIYDLSTTTGATGYGCGRFRLISNKRVENLACF